MQPPIPGASTKRRSRPGRTSSRRSISIWRCSTAFLVLALVSFKRKSVPLKFVTFAVAIGYMGFAKSYLISITNIFSVIDWNWPVFKYNLAWYLFFGFTVVSTILWGRLYCGRICAYGALTQTLDAVLPAKLARRRAAIDREARVVHQVRRARPA